VQLRSLARAGVIVGGLYVGSRATGWLRSVLISAMFGASRDLDAFYAAFRIPDLMFQVVAAGALASALVPLLSGLFADNDTALASLVVSTVTTAMVLALGLLGIAAFITAPAAVPILAGGFDDATIQRTIGLTRIMLLSPVFLALGSVATSLLNAQNRFVTPAAAPIAYNLAIVAGAILLGPAMGVTGVACGVVAGSVLHVAVQLPSLRRLGLHYRIRIDWRNRAARRAFVLMVPRALGLAASQFGLAVSTSLASRLAVGSITAFNVAFTILQIPIGVISVPIGIVALPSLSRQLSAGLVDDFVTLVTRSVRGLIYLIVPMTALGVVLRGQIVTILFGYGKFQGAALEVTAQTLAFMLIGLTAESLTAVLARAFYAGRDTRTPVAAAVLAVAINISLGLLLVGFAGLVGLACAFSAAAWAEALTLLALFGRRYHAGMLGPLARLFGEVGLGALAAGAVTMVTLLATESLLPASPGKVEILIELLVTACAGTFAYVAIGAVLRIPEQGALLRWFRASALRRHPR
jgi:putative peptidoglycan lipid II flippase